MNVSAESPHGSTVPSVETTTVQHSRTLSKTRVTSANLASVGEPSLGTSAGNIVSGEKPMALSASTPRRQPSFRDQQQPTPRGSLQWPSTHRSFSSATATRDSSRHSQATDRVNTAGGGLSLSATASTRGGRAPSSTCRTPMSSRDEHSERRSSAISGVGTGGVRRGHSLGSHPMAPPLVDVGDSPCQGPQSASYSVYTTGLCTPRDNATVLGHDHPSSASGHSISATLSTGTRNVATPAPPPLDDFEAEAQTLTREELEEKVEQMRGDNLVLRTSVLRLRESLAVLQEGMRANYADIERRQDSIANMLLRRLEATKQHRAKLVAHLRNVEVKKASQEKKLHETRQSIKDLSMHLKREEQEIAERLQRRLEKLHAQREQLDRVLEQQTSSLQQLEQLVEEVAEVDPGDDVAGAAPPSTLSTPDASANDSLTAASVLAQTAGPAAVAFLAQAGSSTSTHNAHERSISRVSATSSTAGTTMATTATAANVAYDPNAVIRYLEEEIAAAESLRSDALNKANQYVATRERLERRLMREKERKAAQESCTEVLRQELRSASTAVNEKVALQETAFEMEVDRYLNSSHFGGDIISSASSTGATPKLRAASAVANRAHSSSPCAGVLTAVAAASGVGGARPSTGGSHTPAPQPPVDSFLLPSSSFNSGPQTTLGGRPDTCGVASSAAGAFPTGLLMGDSAAHPTPSSSIHINTSVSRDETTASSEGTPHTTRLLVQDTSRMVAPRPVTSAESTPLRTPLATPPVSMSQGPAA